MCISFWLHTAVKLFVFKEENLFNIARDFRQLGLCI
uniref:Uncharacterized protein n=1 Tax=Anguilla anguilla TaxID=7936 RepID=A0A0E9U0J3_ANGAN